MGASMWRGGRSKDGPWNQPLSDRRHLSSVKTSDTWTNTTYVIGITGVAVTKKGPVGYSYLVKGDGRNFKKDERVQRRYERLYYALWLEVTWWQRWRVYETSVILKHTHRHSHKQWDTHCLLSRDRGFPRRCSATEAPDTGWKQRASPPTHHHGTKEHLERRQKVSCLKKENMQRTSRQNLIERAQKL